MSRFPAALFSQLQLYKPPLTLPPRFSSLPTALLHRAREVVEDGNIARMKFSVSTRTVGAICHSSTAAAAAASKGSISCGSAPRL